MLIKKTERKKIKSILKPQFLLIKMCLLIKDQARSTWRGQHTYSKQATEPQNETLQFTDPSGSWKIPDVRVDSTFMNLLEIFY